MIAAPMDSSLPDYARLVARIAPGSRLLRTWLLEGGISADTLALELLEPGGGVRRLVARRPRALAGRHDPPAAEAEYHRLQLVQALGLAAPAPVYLDRLGEFFRAPGLVMTYVAGQPEFAPPDPVGYARQMALGLAQIHQADWTLADPAWLPPLSPGMAAELERPVAVAADWDTGRIRRRLTQALERASSFEAGAARPVLLHGDYWPGNILWREGAIAAVIDWEDACLGDPLQDFAIARLDLLWIYGRPAFDAFTAAYRALCPFDLARLPAWDLSAALRLARLAGPDLPGWAAFFHPYGRSDITPDSILAAYAFFVEQAERK